MHPTETPYIDGIMSAEIDDHGNLVVRCHQGRTFAFQRGDLSILVNALSCRGARFNKAGEPTTRIVAEAIEKMRGVLFHEYGVDFVFAVSAKNALIASSSDRCARVVHAVVREPNEGGRRARKPR